MRSAWVSIVTVVGALVTASASLAVAVDPEHRVRYILIAGLVAVAVSALTVVDRYRRDHRQNVTVPEAMRKAREATTVAINDGFEPITEKLAELLEAPLEKREAMRGALVTAIINTTAHVIGPDGTRACWYPLDDPDLLTCEVHAGRAGRAKTEFKRHTRSGDLVLRTIEGDGEPVFCRDIQVDPPVGFDAGTSRAYRTFISVPVRTRTTAYGMLSIDAPNPGDLLEEHKGLALVLAALLAATLAVPLLDRSGEHAQHTPA